MDKIAKALKKLSIAERKRLEGVLRSLLVGKLAKMDVKKLKGRSDIFRLRVGYLRVIFQKKSDKIFILTISRRNEQTYKF